MATDIPAKVERGLRKLFAKPSVFVEEPQRCKDISEVLTMLCRLDVMLFMADVLIGMEADLAAYEARDYSTFAKYWYDGDV